MILCGYFFYLCEFDYFVFKFVVDDVGVFMMVDVFYVGGFIVGGVFVNFMDVGFDVFMMMMYKILCGLCGGLIVCIDVLVKKIDVVVFFGF